MNKFHSHSLSLKSLVGVALQDWNSDTSWTAISELQMRGSPEALAMARRFSRSRNPRKRALGLYIASQLRARRQGAHLGSSEYALEETQQILLAGLSDDKVEVVIAAISGMGHRPHPLALPALVKFAAHPHERVRFQVAVALGRYADDAAIGTLIRLAADSADDVRDWATFSVGAMQDADNADIRNCLWKNLHDVDADVRGEALDGLAVRKDDRVIPVLLSLLNDDSRVYELNAAAHMASTQLLPRLNAIKASVAADADLDTHWYHALEDAIAACGGART